MISKRLRAALNKAISKDPHLKQVVGRRGMSEENVDRTILEDNYEFEGSMVVDGKFCKTAGEYKEALSKVKTTTWGGTSG